MPVNFTPFLFQTLLKRARKLHREKHRQIRAASPCPCPCCGEHSISLVTIEDANRVSRNIMISRLGQLVQTRTPIPDTSDPVKTCDLLSQLKSLSFISPLAGDRLRSRCRRSTICSRSSMPGSEAQVWQWWAPSWTHAKRSVRVCAVLAAMNDKHRLSIAF